MRKSVWMLGRQFEELPLQIEFLLPLPLPFGSSTVE